MTASIFNNQVKEMNAHKRSINFTSFVTAFVDVLSRYTYDKTSVYRENREERDCLGHECLKKPSGDLVESASGASNGDRRRRSGDDGSSSELR